MRTGHLMWKECKDVYNDWSLGTSIFLITAGVGLLVLAAGSLIGALRLSTMQGHLKRYQAILTGVESIGIQQIADITHSRPSKVPHEIQTMIDSDDDQRLLHRLQLDQVVSKKYIPKTSHKTVVTCSGCGGNNEVIVGITKHCSFCGEPLMLGTT